MPIFGEHHQANSKLGQPKGGLQQYVPGWSGRRQDSGELQDGRWHAKDSRQKGGQDEPEHPTPTPEHPDAKQRDEGRESGNKGELHEPTVADRQSQGLVVDLRRERENHQKAAPRDEQEAQNKRLTAAEHA